MPSKPLELPLAVAKAFARDMRPILMNLAVSATTGESRAVTGLACLAPMVVTFFLNQCELLHVGVERR
jgi:hypothetical protein